MPIFKNRRTKVIPERMVGMVLARPLVGALTALLAYAPQSAVAQTGALTTPADFASAAAACVDAVSPDKLDTGKLLARGWTKQGDHKAPFGAATLFAHPKNSARIYASLTPSGYCIVDGCGQNAVQFDNVQAAVGDRLLADYGVSGLSDVKSGVPGSSERRQGFVVGNAVGAFSAVMRKDGFNYRFTTVNTKFAGSPTTFQTARPPLTEAEIAENRAKDMQHFAYASEVAPPESIVPIVNACATALRSNAAFPEGWRKSTHGSGTPRGVNAIKSRDIKSTMAGMAHSRQLLYREGHRGLVTKYFLRGTHMVCEAIVKIDPAQREQARGQILAALGLGKPQKPSAQVREFAAEYALDDITETFEMGNSTVALRAGSGTSFDKPDPAFATFSIFVF